ncbi:hypothetical protein L1887_16549 [Cichorium endivia]|nr:hypothetical protein L1887_16549 [Cichorium endivia]
MIHHLLLLLKLTLKKIVQIENVISTGTSMINPPDPFFRYPKKKKKTIFPFVMENCKPSFCAALNPLEPPTESRARSIP